ncbi:MAG: ferric reductase-like transmembrane domain-containing protein [Terriglobia bacterium]
MLSLISALDLTADTGLIAVVCATLNLGIGLLIWGRYSPWRNWPHRRFDVFRLHRWTGYGTLGFTLLHPIPLLFLKQPHFRLVDVALPIWSPRQPVENTIGAVALYLLVMVIVTSLYRVGLGRKLWKKFHYLTYAAAAALFIHGILTDPQLKNPRIDPFDGEKVLVEVCLMLAVIATIWRVRHRRKKLNIVDRAKPAPVCR